MLKAMFNKIQSLLGSAYGLFSEFNPRIFESEEILSKYLNIGVLYVNNGNLGKMPDGAMMEINYTLQLFMRIDDSVNVSDVVVDPLNKLATNTTGEVITDDDNAGKFFLNTGLPTGDGEIVEGAGNRNYIKYELPISVIFTKGINIADNAGITVTIDDKTYMLKSVLSVTEVPQTQLETSSFVNASGSNKAMQNESMVVASGWSIQINKLYRSDVRDYDEHYIYNDVDIRKCILNTPNKVVTITYKNEPHQVIFHDCTFASELGQAEVMTINASAAMRGV